VPIGPPAIVTAPPHVRDVSNLDVLLYGAASGVELETLATFCGSAASVLWSAIATGRRRADVERANVTRDRSGAAG